MEDIYENLEHDDLKASPNRAAPRRSNSRVPGAALLCLGLLSAALLAALVGLAVHYLVVVRGSAAEASTADITELLRVERNKSSSLTEEREQLKARITEVTEEREQLKARITEVTEELRRLQSSSSDEKTCPAGWKMFSRVCYFLSERLGSWDAGREDCRARGADLVVISSTEELSFLSALTKDMTWIGLTDREMEGTWKWIDGTEATLTYWTARQPDNGGGDPRFGEEDCAHINFYFSFWNDQSCQSSLRWICEKVA